jgi:hypothetical protein
VNNCSYYSYDRDPSHLIDNKLPLRRGMQG